MRNNKHDLCLGGWPVQVIDCGKQRDYKVCCPALDLSSDSCIWLSLLEMHQIFVENQCEAGPPWNLHSLISSILLEMKKLVIFHICALPVIRQGWTPPPPWKKNSGSAPDIGPNVTSLEVVRRTKMLDSTMFKSECLVVLWYHPLHSIHVCVCVNG